MHKYIHFYKNIDNDNEFKYTLRYHSSDPDQILQKPSIGPWMIDYEKLPVDCGKKPIESEGVSKNNF